MSQNILRDITAFNWRYFFCSCQRTIISYYYLRLQKYFLPVGRKSVLVVCAKRHPDVIKRWNAWNRKELNIAACSCWATYTGKMPEHRYFKGTMPRGSEVQCFGFIFLIYTTILNIICTYLIDERKIVLLAFERCVRDPYCAARAVNQYIQRYAKVIYVI